VEQLTVWGATFAAAILPWIHACDPLVAVNVLQMMQVGSPNSLVDFSQLRDWLEAQYTCLAITCQEVGGVYDQDANDWFPGGQPCGVLFDCVLPIPASSVRVYAKWVYIGPAIGASAAMIVGIVVAWLCCRRKGKQETGEKEIKPVEG
jgi:hypothetical protein